MVFLGVQFNTNEMTMSVTAERLLELLSYCRSLLTADSVSHRDLQSLLWSYVFCYRQCPSSTHFYVWPTKYLMRQPISMPLSLNFRGQIGFALLVPFPPTVKRRNTHQVDTLAEQPFFLVH